jgi:hypothetical protein
LVSVALYASTALANAPPDQYRLFSAADPYIVDVFTNLTWQRQVVLLDTWQAAQAYCDTLSLPPGSPWRLPSVKELLTLVDETPHGEYDNGTGLFEQKWIDPSAFLGTPVDFPYWSSSVYAPNGQDVWLVDFRDGTTNRDTPMPKHTNYARCVHD